MLTAVQNTLLSSIAAFLKGEKYQAPLETDWKALFHESVSQAVALSCLQGLDERALPDEAKKGWQGYAMRCLQSNIRIHEQHAYVHELLTAAGIPYVILKGCASAYYYPDPLMRAMGDVDFLIAEEDVERATKLLEAQGLTAWKEKHVCHIVFRKDKLHLELHFKPAGLPDGKMGERILEQLADIYTQARAVELDGNPFQQPSDFHHGLIILMHTYHHMLSEGIGLRHLCDWAVFVKHLGEDFASLFHERLSDVGLWKFAQILSYTAHLYLRIPYCEWMEAQDEALCEALISDVLSGGNFGEKDEGRKAQGLVISDRGKDGVGKKSKLSQVFSTANKAGQVRFPRMAKIPILKHFCFIPLGIRHAFLVMTGKRKRLKLAGNMKQAEARKKIYQQFQLFETGEKK